jgi:hypothetical protein
MNDVRSRWCGEGSQNQQQGKAFHLGLDVDDCSLIVGSSFFFLLLPTARPKEAAVPDKIDAG